MFKNKYSNDISLHGGIPKEFYHLKNKEFDEWEIAPWELTINTDSLIGYGTWANVYLAEWRKTTVVAKVLKNEVDAEAKKLIIKEFNNMTKIHHPNIVQLFGYVEEPFIIVMEYFENGDLYKNLKKLSLKQKIKIANDIIKGLIYIHERRPMGLIHRDLKLRNILLTNSYTAKIGDFGLSTFTIDNIVKITSHHNLQGLVDSSIKNEESNKKKVNNNNNNVTISGPLIQSLELYDLTDNVGTQRYMAPEMQTNFYNNKVDVYSCGILLYELFTCNLYISEFNWITKNGNNVNKKLIMLINEMTNILPNNRPTASNILSKFNNIKFYKYSILKRFI